MADKLGHEHVPTGGLNHDDSDWIIPAEDYRMLINGRSTSAKEGHVGTVKNIKGTTEVFYNLPAGENVVVGSEKDIERNSIIYLLYNSNDNHAILRYNITDGVIEPILENEPLLEFNPQYPIAFIDIIKELMYWAQTNVAPKKINLVKARQYTLGTGGYSAITQQTLDAIQYPPGRPDVRFSHDPTNSANNIHGNMFQFTTLYQYVDGEKSAWGPFSNIALPKVSNEKQNGEMFSTHPINNRIIIDVSTGTDLVEKIHIAARQGNNGDWLLIDILDKEILNIGDNTIYSYNFYNTRDRVGLDQANVLRPFDFVPQIAGSQELLSEENMLCYGRCTEGYDNLATDIELIPGYEEIFWTGASPFEVIPIGEMKYLYSVQTDSITFSLGQVFPIQDASLFLLSYIDNDNNAVQVVYEIQPSDLVFFPIQYGQSLVAAINAAGGDASFSIFGFITLNNVSGQGPYFSTQIMVGPSYFFGNKRYTGFKFGATHPFGIVYFDRAKRTGAVNEDITEQTKSEVYIPFYTESDSPLTGTNLYRANISWKIKHQPPQWATDYQWYYAKNRSVSYFVQFVLKEIVDNGNGTQTLDIEPLNNHAVTYPKSQLSAYVFANGDRVRFITQAGTSSVSVGPLLDEYLDIEILGADPNNVNGLLIDNSIILTGYGITSSGNSLVEIYTPQRGAIVDSELYYAHGSVYPIGNPHTNDRYHTGETQNQDPNDLSGTPATGVFRSGDVYHLPRAFGIAFVPGGQISAPWQVESDSYSDFYVSNSYDLGRVNVVDGEAERRTFNIVRHGQRYFEKTKLNGLSTFYFDDFTDKFSDQHGPINAIIEVGYTLKVLQSLKNSSIYIGRTVTTDGGQGQVTLKSDEVFGTVIPSEDDYGTVDPLSVEKYHRYLYFYDRINGLYIRDAANGMFPISSYKMTKFFKEISEDVINGAIRSLKILSIYDQKNERLIVTFSFDQGIVANYTGTTGAGTYTEAFTLDGYDFGFELYPGIAITIRPNDTDVISGTILTAPNTDGEFTIQTPGPPLTEFYIGSTKGVSLSYKRGLTLSFKEGENRWKEFYSYNPEMYGRCGDLLLSWKDGELSIHDSNDKHNTFYSTEYPLVHEIVINQMAKKSKVYDAMSIYANRDGWRATIEIDPTDENVTGMKSRIEVFTAKEEGYHAAFLKDELTPNAPSQEYALINGRELRSPVARVKLENSTILELILRRIVAKLTSSEQTT